MDWKGEGHKEGERTSKKEGNVRTSIYKSAIS